MINFELISPSTLPSILLVERWNLLECMGIIYQAYNTVTGKSYVGQTVKDLATRRSRHYSAAKTKKYKFAQALKKYAEKYWIWKVLIKVPINYLDEYEIFFISELNCCRDGYNSHPGGYMYEKNTGVIFDFYHPSYGIVSCTRKELQEKYLLNERSLSAVYRLIKFPDACCNGWILAKNKDRYSEIVTKKYQVVALVHKEYGIQTLTRQEFMNTYGLDNDKISKILNQKRKSSLEWGLPQQLQNAESSSFVELTHPTHGTYKITKKEFRIEFGLTRHGLSALITGIQKTHKGWSLSENSKQKQKILKHVAKPSVKFILLMLKLIYLAFLTNPAVMQD